jgi:hypothetical protein
MLFSFADTDEGRGKETRSSLIGSVGGLFRQTIWLVHYAKPAIYILDLSPFLVSFYGSLRFFSPSDVLCLRSIACYL